MLGQGNNNCASGCSCHPSRAVLRVYKAACSVLQQGAPRISPHHQAPMAPPQCSWTILPTRCSKPLRCQPVRPVNQHLQLWRTALLHCQVWHPCQNRDLRQNRRRRQTRHQRQNRCQRQNRRRCQNWHRCEKRLQHQKRHQRRLKRGGMESIRTSPLSLCLLRMHSAKVT